MSIADAPELVLVWTEWGPRDCSGIFTFLGVSIGALLEPLIKAGALAGHAAESGLRVMGQMVHMTEGLPALTPEKVPFIWTSPQFEIDEPTAPAVVF